MYMVSPIGRTNFELPDCQSYDNTGFVTTDPCAGTCIKHISVPNSYTSAVNKMYTLLIAVILFPWWCLWSGCIITFCQMLRIHHGNIGSLFLLSMCSLWCVQMIGYIMACGSRSFFRTLHYLTMQTYLQALNFYDAFQIYAEECVCKTKSMPLIMPYSIHGTVYFQLIHLSCDDCENV